MAKRPSKEIKISILNVLRERKNASYGELERKINTNWKTIRTQCDELKLFDTITISENNKINITKNGLKLLKTQDKRATYNKSKK